MNEAPDRTESVFAAAALLADADERAALLDRECGDDRAMRGRVEALLRAHARAGHLLDQPPPGRMEQTGAYVAGELPGTVIAGKYALVEVIGEGGMGSVWRAKQSEPVKRFVAVKLIKAGMDSKQVLARFDAERQALAVMDHPNIAKVLDGGLTEAGRPFFVMEYVKGVAITEYCDAARLSVPERLNLFVQVCRAVQHAHQKGIIHRDLKPSNILVAPYDDKPVPKVIDFGLAKAMHQSLTEMTLHTAHETVLGTPLYMSPEQAQLNNLDVDTRSDVYSLGVLLYELLTGTTPLEKNRCKEAAWEEVRRLIREEEPPRPSTRLSSTDTLASLAAGRQIEPLRLTRLVRGELDWIVMKSLEKDRARRYETANGFASDVERYLAGEPVLAAPPSTRYRLKKFVRRNRPQVVAATLVLVALLSGIAGTTIGLIEARRQKGVAVDEAAAKEQARQAEAGQRGIAEAAAIAEREAKVRERVRADGEAKERKRADTEKERAIRFLDRALDALRATTGDDVEKLIGSKKELTANERAYLEAIAKRWQDFAKQSAADAEARIFQAEGHFRVAGLWHRLGRLEEACSEYRSARDARKSLLDQFPTDHEHQHELAKTRLDLGILLAETGHPSEGQVEIQAALKLLTDLVTQDPDSRRYQSDLAVSRCNLGAIFAEQSDPNHAVLEFIAAHDLQEKLVEQFPDDIEYQRRLAHTCNSLGVILVQCGKRDDAVLLYREASRLQKKLVTKFPGEADYQEALADSHNGLGIVLSELGRLDEARSEYMASLDARKKLADQFLAIPRHQIDLGGSYCNFGNLIRDGGEPAESLESLDRAVKTLHAVLQKEPHDSRAKEYLRNSHVGRAQTYDQLKKYEQANKDWDLAIEFSPPLQRPGLRARRVLSRFQSGLIAEALAELGELTKSKTWTSPEWYNFACLYSVASAKVADKRIEYEERAVEMLRNSVKVGFKDVALLTQDPNLNVLRQRVDFKSLVAELEKQFPPVKRSKPD